MTKPFEAHDQLLSNENLEELYKELDRKQSKKAKNEEGTPRVIKTIYPKRIFSTIERLMHELCEFRPYSEILNERNHKFKQLKLDTFFRKI